MRSRQVSSNQQGVHPHLVDVVEKHLTTLWQKPIKPLSEAVFDKVQAWLALDQRPLILDSGCGTGLSTLHLAARFADCRVLGFDRSEVRLAKQQGQVLPENCLILRADADDLWRQLKSADIRPVRHFLFFPNPYPKSAQLNQRWHGSPVFPYLVALGGVLEVRSNWKTYLDELAIAVRLAAGIEVEVDAYVPTLPFSRFEAKYHASGHSLWRLSADLT